MSPAASPGAALSALRPDRQVTCQECGKVFTAKDSRAKFCSNRCRQADKYRRAKAGREGKGAKEGEATA